jgi:hypothetical protein
MEGAPNVFSLFKKWKKKDERDIEQVIFDFAEYKKDEDFQLLCRLMQNREVYVPIDSNTVPAAARPGVPYVTGAGDRLLFRAVEIPGNGMWAPAATKPTHRLLAQGYAGMPWLGFLDMARKVESMRGAYLQGETSWVAMDRQKIAHVLSLSNT